MIEGVEDRERPNVGTFVETVKALAQLPEFQKVVLDELVAAGVRVPKGDASKLKLFDDCLLKCSIMLFVMMEFPKAFRSPAVTDPVSKAA